MLSSGTALNTFWLYRVMWDVKNPYQIMCSLSPDKVLIFALYGVTHQFSGSHVTLVVLQSCLDPWGDAVYGLNVCPFLFVCWNPNHLDDCVRRWKIWGEASNEGDNQRNWIDPSTIYGNSKKQFVCMPKANIHQMLNLKISKLDFLDSTTEK